MMRDIDRFLTAISLAIVAVVCTTLAVLAQTTGGDKVTRNRMAVSMTQDPSGTITSYENWAAYPWHLGTDTPDRPDGGFTPGGAPVPDWPINTATTKPLIKWPIVAEYTKAGPPSIVWYWDKSFRTSNGYKWGKPLRWAYLRMVEEVWNPTTKQFEIPGLTPTPGPPPVVSTPGKGGVHLDDIAGQQLVDLLKRSFTTTEIQDKMDASPYDEPDTGAPEDGPISANTDWLDYFPTTTPTSAGCDWSSPIGMEAEDPTIEATPL